MIRATIILLAVFTLWLMAAGCQTPAQIGAAGAVASSTLSADLSMARSHLEASAAKDDPHVVAAHVAVIDGQAQMPAVEKMPVTIAAQAKTIADDHASFWSYRQRALFWTVVIAAAVFLSAAVALYFLTPFGPVIGEVSAFFFHVLTGGLTKIGSMLNAGLAAKLATAREKTNVGSIGGTAVVVNPVPAVGSSLIPIADPIPGSADAPIAVPSLITFAK